MSVASEVAICNLALGWLGGNLITSIDDESVEARLCDANYTASRDRALNEREWSFALARASLPALSEPPAWGYANQFQLPSDCMIVRYVSDAPRPEEDQPIDYRVEGGRILANADRVYIRYSRVSRDITKYSPLFIQAVASRLASDIAIPISASRSLMVDLEGKYQMLIKATASTDGQQGSHEKVRTTRLSRVRG